VYTGWRYKDDGATRRIKKAALAIMLFVGISVPSLGDVVGQRELDELLARRGQVNEQLRASVDEQSKAWGGAVIRVEIKDLETF